MKPVHPIFVVLTAALTTPVLALSMPVAEDVLADPTNTTAALKCRSKNDDVYTAISKFCGTKAPIYVPSTYAYNGIPSGKYQVYIGGNCSPKAWVPQEYCYSQLFDMCVDEKEVVEYGHDTCQVWQIASY